MSNTIDFPNKQAVEEAAADWIAAVDRGLSSSEQKQLEAWLQVSPLHADTFVEMAALWDQFDALNVVRKVMPCADTTVSAKPRVLYRSGKAAMAMAASIICAVGLTVGLYVYESKPAPIYYQAGYQTAVGAQEAFELPDGSTITLNTGTKVSVQFREDQRLVNLHQGEAYFNVAKDPSAPFVTEVNGATVTAVGTTFSVRRQSASSYEVMVTEGKVRVAEPPTPMTEEQAANPGRSWLLGYGDRLAYANSDASKRTGSSDLELNSELAWLDGMLVFTGEPLSAAIDEINRYTSFELVIADDTIADTPVGGTFRAADTEQVLLVLATNFGIHHTKVGNQYRLAKKND
jgi:transmembrane sensor